VKSAMEPTRRTRSRPGVLGEGVFSLRGAPTKEAEKLASGSWDVLVNAPGVVAEQSPVAGFFDTGPFRERSRAGANPRAGSTMRIGAETLIVAPGAVDFGASSLLAVRRG